VPKGTSIVNYHPDADPLTALAFVLINGTWELLRCGKPQEVIAEKLSHDSINIGPDIGNEHKA
jgi:hypothetical protein